MYVIIRRVYLHRRDFLELGEVLSGGRLTSGLGTLAEHLGGLVATDSSTPLAALLLVLVGEVGLGGRDEGSELALILGADLLDGDDGSGLLVDDGTEAGLALDDDVGDTHLAAESGEVDDELNGVDIVGDDNESSLLGLDEGDDVVKTVLGEEGLLGVLDLLALSGGSGSGGKTGLLLLLGLGAVLVEELEELGRGVLVESVGELSDGGGNLEALVQDDLLALEADIFGPLDEAGEVTDGLDVLANAEVFGGGLEERVLLGLGGLASTEGGSSGLLGRGLGFGRLVIETRLACNSKVGSVSRSSSVER